jgi:CheY-like chemotaxis protein
LSGLKVLIVDDDAGVCQSLKDLLVAEGCCVEDRRVRVHGLEWLQRQSFDLVLSDVVMPDMDGYELKSSGQIRRYEPALPVDLCTDCIQLRHRITLSSSGVCLEGYKALIFKKKRVNPRCSKNKIITVCNIVVVRKQISQTQRPRTLRSAAALASKDE